MRPFALATFYRAALFAALLLALYPPALLAQLPDADPDHIEVDHQILIPEGE